MHTQARAHTHNFVQARHTLTIRADETVCIDSTYNETICAEGHSQTQTAYTDTTVRQFVQKITDREVILTVQ